MRPSGITTRRRRLLDELRAAVFVHIRLALRGVVDLFRVPPRHAVVRRERCLPVPLGDGVRPLRPRRHLRIQGVPVPIIVTHRVLLSFFRSGSFRGHDRLRGKGFNRHKHRRLGHHLDRWGSRTAVAFPQRGLHRGPLSPHGFPEGEPRPRPVFRDLDDVVAPTRIHPDPIPFARNGDHLRLAAFQPGVDVIRRLHVGSLPRILANGEGTRRIRSATLAVFYVGVQIPEHHHGDLDAVLAPVPEYFLRPLDVVAVQERHRREGVAKDVRCEVLQRRVEAGQVPTGLLHGRRRDASRRRFVGEHEVARFHLGHIRLEDAAGLAPEGYGAFLGALPEERPRDFVAVTVDVARRQPADFSDA